MAKTSEQIFGRDKLPTFDLGHGGEQFFLVFRR